jgi:hypothetical protein
LSEDDEIGEALLDMMAALTGEHPGADRATMTDLLKERIRVHPRRAEFEAHLIAVLPKADAEDRAFFKHLLDATR